MKMCVVSMGTLPWLVMCVAIYLLIRVRLSRQWSVVRLVTCACCQWQLFMQVLDMLDGDIDVDGDCMCLIVGVCVSHSNL